MAETIKSDKETKQRILYLTLVFGSCYLLFFIALFGNKGRNSPIYQILQKGFTAFPVLAAITTRWLTKDKTPWRISIKVWKQPKLWAFSALVPGILIALGTALYFALFPKEYSGSFHYGGLFTLTGMEASGGLLINSPFLFTIITVLITATFSSIHLLELGEEIGWREYLLPKQIARYGTHRAVLLNGILWGFAHLPLVCFGFNYSSENPGAPWSNIAMMMVVCVTLGIILSYVMVISGNVMFPAIIHGVVNIIGEVPVYLSITHESSLLAPIPPDCLACRD